MICTYRDKDPEVRGARSRSGCPAAVGNRSNLDPNEHETNMEIDLRDYEGCIRQSQFSVIVVSNGNKLLWF